MNVEFADEVAGVYFRSVILWNAGDIATQHVHDYDHATLCGAGSARMLVNGIFERMVAAGEAVMVRKGLKHSFEAMVAGTRLVCIHIAASAEAAKEKELLKCPG